ncbi:hypothetical protein LXL04_002765 [Taraxacum kok-saghyz]
MHNSSTTILATILPLLCLLFHHKDRCSLHPVSVGTVETKLVKTSLEALDRSSEANRNLPGCGPGSSTDRTRVSVVNGLRKQRQSSMKSFTELRQKMASEHRETVQRSDYTVTGENPDEGTLDNLISTGESETFYRKRFRSKGESR